MIMNRLTMLAVTLMASMACFAQGKFDKGMVTSVGTGKALYECFDYQELRYRVTKADWSYPALSLSGYEVEVIGFASYISGADGNPDYISNSSLAEEGGFDGKITICQFIPKDVAGVDMLVKSVAANAFTSTTCYDDAAANKTQFAEAAAKVKTIVFAYNRGEDDKYTVFSAPTINATAFAGLTAVTTVESFIPGEIVVNIPKDAFASSTYKNATLKVPEGSVKAYQAATGWKRFKAVTDGTVLYGDVDGNGSINLLDYKALLAAVKAGSSSVSALPAGADVDGNGKTNLLDYKLLLNKVKGVVF